MSINFVPTGLERLFAKVETSFGNIQSAFPTATDAVGDLLSFSPPSFDQKEIVSLAKGTDRGHQHHAYGHYEGGEWSLNKRFRLAAGAAAPDSGVLLESLIGLHTTGAYTIADLTYAPKSCSLYHVCFYGPDAASGSDGTALGLYANMIGGALVQKWVLKGKVGEYMTEEFSGVCAGVGHVGRDRVNTEVAAGGTSVVLKDNAGSIWGMGDHLNSTTKIGVITNGAETQDIALVESYVHIDKTATIQRNYLSSTGVIWEASNIIYPYCPSETLTGSPVVFNLATVTLGDGTGYGTGDGTITDQRVDSLELTIESDQGVIPAHGAQTATWPKQAKPGRLKVSGKCEMLLQVSDDDKLLNSLALIGDVWQKDDFAISIVVSDCSNKVTIALAQATGKITIPQLSENFDEVLVSLEFTGWCSSSENDSVTVTFAAA